MLLYILAAAGAAAGLWLLKRKTGGPDWVMGLMTLVLPFCVGGFHGYTAAFAALVLIYALCCRKGLTLRWDLTTAAFAAILISLGLSPLWAADRGMTIFGILPWLGAGLYWLTLENLPEKRDRALDLVPLCGAAMTVLSVLMLLLIPQTRQQLTVNGRLAGFFQYPNTFAAFLLCGYILLAARKEWKKGTFPLLILLAWGILLSGSRTAFLLLAFSVFFLMTLRRTRITVSRLPFSLMAGILLGHLTEAMGILQQAGRYLEMDEGGTFFARLLYWQDALPVLAKSPLGVGYYGWRTIQGMIQTGRYEAAYLHNGLLQIAMDAGWLPAVLMGLALLRGIFAKGLASEKRMLLTVLCAYCVVDFHTEYIAIWVLLLGALPAPTGKTFPLTRKQAAIPAALLAAVCLWLGSAQALYHSGNIDACLALAPFHTDAAEARLSRTEDPAQAEALLALDEHRSRGWNTLAWDALDRGDWEKLLEYKDRAIACDRYNTAQYIDYVNCLYTALFENLDAGREEEAWVLAERMLSVREDMLRVEEATSPLALTTGEDNTLTLPENYEEMMIQLETILAE